MVTGEHLVSQGDDVRGLLQSTTQMVLQAVQLWHQSVTGDGPHAANSAEPPSFGPIDGQDGTQA